MTFSLPQIRDFVSKRRWVNLTPEYNDDTVGIEKNNRDLSSRF